MISVTDEMVKAFKLAYVSDPVKSLSPENERIRRSLQAAIDAHLSRGAVGIDDGDELMCCNGHDCGCQGVTKNQYRAYLVAQDRTAVTDQLMIDLYMAASKGFHTSETCGTDNRYCHVSKFRSFEDLHAFSVAWTQAMLASQDEVK